MKSIVVYRMIMGIGILILTTGLEAQKPAIDLISSHQQYKHPESIVDTGFAVQPHFSNGFFAPTTPVQNQYQREETGKKKRRQIGPSLDSLFQKEDTGDIRQEKMPLKISLFNSKYNPIRFLIYITSLK